MVLLIGDLVNVIKVWVLHPVCAAVLLSLNFVLIMLAALVRVDMHILAVLGLAKFLGCRPSVS